MTFHPPGYKNWFQERHRVRLELLRCYGTLQGNLDKRQLDQEAEDVRFGVVAATLPPPGAQEVNMGEIGPREIKCVF